jgi:CRP-like cAMP-binding protein
MRAIWDFVLQLFRRPLGPREFVARLFPGLDPTLLTGLVSRVSLLELTDVGTVVDLNENRQAAMGIVRGRLDSVALTDGAWQAYWRSDPGTVFNTDGLRRKLQGSCLCKVVKQTTLMLLSAEDFEAELKVNQSLAEALIAWS